jgi:rhodanese-related sulfurtransferase
VKKQIVILDVRTSEEYGAGKIENAINIDIKDTVHFLDEILKLEKDQPYLVYCRTGKRSAAAVKLIAELWFTQLLKMKGGYVAWIKRKN